MDKIKPAKKSHIYAAWSLILVCLLWLSLYVIFEYHTTKQNLMLDDMNQRITILEEDISFARSDLNVERLKGLDVMLDPEEESHPFIFTEYGLWDGESGINVSARNYEQNRQFNIYDFIPNDKGIYTYQGHIVLGVGHSAVAPLKEGFKEYQLGEILEVEFDGQRYTGIVMDRCGMCTWGNDTEELQRIDIFTTSKDVIGKVEGYVYE